MQVDIRVAQLLCSRMCHDLIGPIGAVNAGLELQQEAGGADAVDEALSLVVRSANQATNRLAFFRIAFGLRSGIQGIMTIDQVRTLAQGLLAERKVVLDWPDQADWGSKKTVTLIAAQLVLNLVLLGMDSLPRGGTLGVRFANIAGGAGDSGAVGVALTASGRGARVKEEVRAVMDPSVAAEDLSARNIHGHWAALLAAVLGTAIEVTSGAGDEVRLAALLPAGADPGEEPV